MTEPACERSSETAAESARDAIPFSAIPSVSKLFLDFVSDDSTAAAFYRRAGEDRIALREFAKTVAARRFERGALADALVAQNRAFGSSEKTFENIDLLRRPDTVAVVTGQQAGLFTGPLFTIFKALTTVRVADALRADGVPAVPVFWVASEDHDFAEVNHCNIVSRDGDIHQIRYAAHPSDSAQPVGRIVIGEEIGAQIASLESALAGEPFTAEVVSLLRSACAAGTSFSDGFSKVLAQLLRSYGVVLLDPLDPAIKELSKSAYISALEHAGEIAAGLVAQSDALERAGYHAQVRTSPDAVPLFLIENGRRTALEREGGCFFLKGQRQSCWSVRQLVARANEHPADFSPNVTFRPVVQDFLLPCVAYIGGPAEVAYFAQLNPIYSILGQPAPYVLPRASATLVDPQTKKTLDKFRLCVRDFFGGREEVERKVVERVLSGDIAEQFDRLTRVFDDEIDRLRDSLKEFDPTLASALESRRPKVHYHFDHIRQSYIRARAQRDDQVRRRLSAAVSVLFPHRNLQEREINIFSFVARYGFAVVDLIYQSIDPSGSNHQLIALDG